MSSAVSTPAEIVAAVLAVMQPRADACGARLLVVGAAARDLLLATPSARATNDVDVAIAVEYAAQIADVTAGLVPDPSFAGRYRIDGIVVDVVPFGGVEDGDRTVAAGEGFRMNVFGFSEALANAVTVPLPGGQVALVASVPAQVVLKLVAWEDRRSETTKDALDLRSLLVEYAESVHVASMYDGHHDHRLDRNDFDLARAAADRVGAETVAVLGSNAATVIDLVARECTEDALLPTQMGGDVVRNRALLRALLTGMRGP